MHATAFYAQKVTAGSFSQHRQKRLDEGATVRPVMYVGAGEREAKTIGTSYRGFADCKFHDGSL